MVVFTLLFNQALHVKSEYHVPYPLFVFTAMLPWTYFTSCLSASSASIVGTQNLIALNPMAGVIDGFRWAVLGRGLPHYHVYAVSFGIALGVMLSGIWYFRRVERYFADLI